MHILCIVSLPLIYFRLLLCLGSIDLYCAVDITKQRPKSFLLHAQHCSALLSIAQHCSALLSIAQHCSAMLSNAVAVWNSETVWTLITRWAKWVEHHPNIWITTEIGNQDFLQGRLENFSSYIYYYHWVLPPLSVVWSAILAIFDHDFLS